MRALRLLLGALCLDALLLVAPPARAQIPDFCYRYNDHDQDSYVYGSTGIICPRDDCDDNNPAIHPGATEQCGDGVDQDCSGADLPCPGTDDDHDGHNAVSAGGDDCDDHDSGVHPGSQEVCGDGKDNDCTGGDRPCATDADADGYSAAEGHDCNDGDPAVHPHALEICGDGVDQDCSNGDEPCVADRDRDGHLATSMGGDDCDDFDRSTHPGALEVCGDGRDEDCDGSDPACAPKTLDADGDGQSAPGDCDDSDPGVHRGALEVCGDAVDQDCDGRDLSCTASSGDLDGDGYLSVEAGGDDCNDSDASTHPNAAEICGDNRDQDCDGSDAIPGLSAVCSGSPTTNPAFQAIRGAAPARTTAPEASSCSSSGGPGGVWLLPLVVLLYLGRWRR